MIICMAIGLFIQSDIREIVYIKSSVQAFEAGARHEIPSLQRAGDLNNEKFF